MRLVPGTIRSVLRGQRPPIRSDGTLVRDYIYVEDAISAYLALIEALAERPALAGESFNFSTETPIAVRAFVDRILELMGSDLEPLVLNEASSEIPAQYLDASKARRDLNWQPTFGQDEGLRRTIAWYQRRFAESRLLEGVE